VKDAIQRWNGDEGKGSTGAGKGRGPARVTAGTRLSGGTVQLGGDVVS